jgi:hypothetical protein
MINPITLSEQILFSTVRIEAQLNNGETSIGTGFFFNFPLDAGKTISAIITNKHVIKDSKVGRFQLHESNFLNGKSVPSGHFSTIELHSFENLWVPHPKREVDLCAMLIEPLQKEVENRKQSIFFVALDSELILDDTDLHGLSAVEDVLMVGYPIGLWDTVNNLPLIRRGITATHPSIDFCGKSEGVIDTACFPGSSGSPVLIINEGVVRTKAGDKDRRAILLGVLFAGPHTTTEGEILIEEIPTSSRPVIITPQMIHLGYIVKAKEILALGEHIKNIQKQLGVL